MSSSGSKGIRLDHIAVAVDDLDAALKVWRDQLGLDHIETEVVEEQGVRVAKLDIGNTHIELLEPLNENTPVGKFLKARGPGLHHMCVGVDDILEQIDVLKNSGTRLIDEKPKMGASGAKIAFVHPKSTGGVLLELSQPAAHPQAD
ncbi:MAG TPA: methylmalonyl-CoA epimerase [Planktothrix sp.]|jgi:methylmalonyl-CoA epimerase